MVKEKRNGIHTRRGARAVGGDDSPRASRPPPRKARTFWVSYFGDVARALNTPYMRVRVGRRDYAVQKLCLRAPTRVVVASRKTRKDYRPTMVLKGAGIITFLNKQRNPLPGVTLFRGCVIQPEGGDAGT